MNDLLEQLLAEAQVRNTLPPPQLCRLLRLRAGLSQSQLAEVVGVDRASVSRWEAGLRHPRRRAAVRYAEVLERLATQTAQREVNTG